MKHKERKQALAADYRATFMGTDHGRRVLEDLMFRFSFFGTTYVPGDPQAMVLNEGARNAILYIREMANLTTAQIDQMYNNISDQSLKWRLDAPQETDPIRESDRT